MKQNEGKVAHKNITFILINSFLKQKKEGERKSALLDRRALFLSDLFITSKQRDDESS